MLQKLEKLAFDLNNSQSGAVSFNAALNEGGDVIEVICSNNFDSPVFITSTDEQILTITPLFQQSDVKEGQFEALHNALLNMSPIIPLSSIGIDGNNYILFGAMAISTTLDNICHELKTQANNTSDVLSALSDFLV